MNNKRDWSCRLLATLMMSIGLVGTAQADVYVKELSTGMGENSGSLALPVGTDNYFVGFQNISVAMDSSGASATSYAAYCVDPAHFSTTAYSNYFSPSTANSVASVFASQATNIQNLYNNYYAGTIGDNAKAGAFQLALWEVANDDQNLYTGAVQVNGSTDATLVANASALLSNLNYSGPNLYDLTFYKVDRSNQGVGQDYLVATPVQPVPEPDNYLLLLSGIALLSFVARRRSTLL